MTGVIGGSVATVLGLALSFLSFLQPWESCPEIDDGSAACPNGRESSALMLVGLVLVVVGVCAIGFGLILRSRGSGVWRP